MDTVNNVTSEAIGAAVEGHRELGPGLLESAYQTRRAGELGQRGLLINFNVERLRDGLRRLVNHYRGPRPDAPRPRPPRTPR